MRHGVSGSATLKCAVAIDGALDKCTIVSETPAGWGFGDAALGVAPAFVMTGGVPDQNGGRPSVRLPIRWQAGAPQINLVGDEQGHLLHTRWLAAPTFSEVSAAYPKKAGGVAGYVALSCGLYRQNGRVIRCRVMTEDPAGLGFANAALSLTPRFQADIPDKPRKEAMALWTELRVRFPAPATDSSNRVLDDPLWMVDRDPAAMAAFPPEALAAGQQSGVGVAECDVTVDRTLAHCLPSPERPPGLGFSQAAAKISSGARLSAWTEEGTAVDDAKARVEISFDHTLPVNAASARSARP